MSEIVEEFKIDDPHEFLKELELTHDNWYLKNFSFTGRYHRWIFRGQEDSTWDLTFPSFRKENEALLQSTGSIGVNVLGEEDRERYISKCLGRDDGRADLGKVDKLFLRGFQERELVELFFSNADRIGIELPKLPEFTETKFFKVLDAMFDSQSIMKPFDPPRFFDVNETYCIARHHGLPVRLLDWSSQPMIATYFAARGVLDQPHKKFERIAVWAWGVDERDWYRKIPGLEHYVPRTARNPNMQAQKGSFVIATGADMYYLKYGEWPSMTDLIEVAIEAFAGKYAMPILKKFTLPSKYAPQLLSHLKNEGINNAELMRTLDGAAKAVREDVGSFGSPYYHPEIEKQKKELNDTLNA